MILRGTINVFSKFTLVPYNWLVTSISTWSPWCLKFSLSLMISFNVHAGQFAPIGGFAYPSLFSMTQTNFSTLDRSCDYSLRVQRINSQGQVLEHKNVIFSGVKFLANGADFDIPLNVMSEYIDLSKASPAILLTAPVLVLKITTSSQPNNYGYYVLSNKIQIRNSNGIQPVNVLFKSASDISYNIFRRCN